MIWHLEITSCATSPNSSSLENSDPLERIFTVKYLNTCEWMYWKYVGGTYPQLISTKFSVDVCKCSFLSRFLSICFCLYDLYRFDLDKTCLHQAALYIRSKVYSVKNHVILQEEINVSIKSNA